MKNMPGVFRGALFEKKLNSIGKCSTMKKRGGSKKAEFDFRFV
jgi:hypothetical protein